LYRNVERLINYITNKHFAYGPPAMEAAKVTVIVPGELLTPIPHTNYTGSEGVPWAKVGRAFGFIEGWTSTDEKD